MILLVSDLLLPAAHAAEVLRGVPLPGLTALLSRARLREEDAADLSPHALLPDVAWLLDQVVPTADGERITPAGLLRHLDLPDQPAPVAAMLTPCHYALARDHVQLGAIRVGITDAEASVLGDLAQEACDAHGLVLHRPQANRWYLEGADFSALQTADPRRALGRNVDQLLPTSTDQPDIARLWRRLHTEVQMLWHHHPVNEAREARGAPTINGLWLETALAPTSSLRASFQHSLAVREHQALLNAIAQWSTQPTERATHDARGVLWLDELIESASLGDWPAWRDALQELDRAWFSPLAAQTTPLTLVLTGETHRRIYQSRPRSGWAFWRRLKLVEALTT